MAFDYAPAPESRSVVDLRSSYGLFIDGKFVAGHGKPFKSVSPASEEVLAEVAVADESDVDLAVLAARRAFTRIWSRTPGSRSASREMSTSRSPRPTSSTTRAGRTSSSTPRSDLRRERSASPAR